VHQTAMYYEDRLQGRGFMRVMLCGGAAVTHPGEVDDLRRHLEERLTTAVDAVDPRAAVSIGDRIMPSPALLDMMTPLVGLLLRDRKPA